MGRGVGPIALAFRSHAEDRLRTSEPVPGPVSSANMPPGEVPGF